MTERRAWLDQAVSDRHAVERALDLDDPATYCHAIAKCQQAVEKGVKALVATLRDFKIWNIDVGRDHKVGRFFSAFVKVSKATKNLALQKQLRRLCDEAHRQEINNLDRLVPKWPAPGTVPERNTEYPFRNSHDGPWRKPCEPDAFTRSEVESFRSLADRVVRGCGKLISAIEHELP